MSGTQDSCLNVKILCSRRGKLS